MRTQWPVYSSQPNSKVESWEEPETRAEELTENLATVGQTGCEEGATGSSQVATSEVAFVELALVVDEVAAAERVKTEVAVAEVAKAVAEVATTELEGDGAFWSLLSQVGYSSW